MWPGKRRVGLMMIHSPPSPQTTPLHRRILELCAGTFRVTPSTSTPSLLSHIIQTGTNTNTDIKESNGH